MAIGYVIVALAILTPSLALDNGLALTPPMGWMTWHRFRCTIDCDTYPDECISENLLKRTADIMVSEGYLAAGYEYVVVDDCWMEKERDANGLLQADKKRFPSGMKSLADYLHSKGLKFGIYEDYGTQTCEGYPGSVGHLDDDANLFAEWGVDFVKIDGCHSKPEDLHIGFPEYGKSLNKTGRPMLFSCAWAFYESQSDFELISHTCNTWRNHGDVQESWVSVKGIIDFMGKNQDTYAKVAGPGRWNDPDMLIIGNFALSYDEAKVQMAMWAILAAPLLMSTDLAKIRPLDKAVLLNKDVIAVNQDKLGIQGLHVYQQGDLGIWTKPILPKVGEYYTQAIAVVSGSSLGPPTRLTLALETIGLNASAYIMTDLFEPKSAEEQKPSSQLDVRVNSKGVVMLRASPVPS